jgi:hypothetical protein
MKKQNKTKKIKAADKITKKLDLNTLHGAGMDLWNEDAQEYVNRLRKDRKTE